MRGKLLMKDGSPASKLDRRGARYWKMGAAGIATAVTAALIVLFKPPAPSGQENGSFVNDCCGTLRLQDGEMILNDKPATRYTAGRDARGPYILPRSYVGGLENIGFEIDGSRPASKLRPDRIPGPTTLLVPGSGKAYLFKRQPAIFR
jgi:hypothetical protein